MICPRHRMQRFRRALDQLSDRQKNVPRPRGLHRASAPPRRTAPSRSRRSSRRGRRTRQARVHTAAGDAASPKNIALGLAARRAARPQARRERGAEDRARKWVRRHRSPAIDSERNHSVVDCRAQTPRRSRACGRRAPRRAVETSAAARLEPDDVVESRRDAARARRCRCRARAAPDRRRRRRPSPQLEPPGMSVAIEQIARHRYGVRMPTRPVANWSRLVLPTISAPRRAQARPPRLRLSRRYRRRPGMPPWSAAGDVDIVLDCDRNAIKWQRCIVRAGQRHGLGAHVGFVAQRDENRRIVMGANTRIASRHDVRRRRYAGPVGTQYFDGGLGHGEPAGFARDEPMAQRARPMGNATRCPRALAYRDTIKVNEKQLQSTSTLRQITS